MRGTRTCSVLGFTSLALNAKMNSCSYYPILALENGVLLHIRVGVKWVKALTSKGNIKLVHTTV